MTMRVMGEAGSAMATRRRRPQSVMSTSPKTGSPVLVAEDEQIDRYRFEVTIKGQRGDLTPKEFELLATLAGTGPAQGEVRLRPFAVGWS